MGRPSLGWLEDVEKDLREIKVKRSDKRQLTKKNRCLLIKEATTLRRLYSQEVIKYKLLKGLELITQILPL
jgi:hypothetical protein